MRGRTEARSQEEHTGGRELAVVMSPRLRLYAACLFALGSLVCSGRACRLPEPQGIAILSAAAFKTAWRGRDRAPGIGAVA